MIKIMILLVTLMLIFFSGKDIFLPSEKSWQELTRLYFYESISPTFETINDKKWSLAIKKEIPSKVYHKFFNDKNLLTYKDFQSSNCCLVHKYYSKDDDHEIAFVERCKLYKENKKMLICAVECLDHNVYLSVKIYNEI